MASILIRDGMVIPVDGTQKVIEEGYVTIEGNKITSVGKVEGLGKGKRYDLVINAKGKAVLPGFVNAHTHLATECFRGIIDLFPEMYFIFIVKNFLKDNHLYDLGLLGCMELIRFGTTCTGDNYQRSKFIAQAISDSGLRGVVSEQVSQANLLEGIYPAIYKYEPEDADRQLKANIELIEEWHGAQNGRITCAFGPHTANSLTQDMLQRIRGKAEEYGVGIMIHVAETSRELETMRLRYRMTSVEYLAKAGILGPKTVAAHCEYLTQNDIKIFKETGSYIAHCPPNFIRNGRSTPLISWLKGGIRNICLGSDNVLYDPFEAMRFSNCLALQYVKQVAPDSLHLVPSAWETLEMMTSGSARALGLGDDVGSLEVGKKADVIIVDLQKPHLTPNLDIASNLVHYANGNDVETTIVDGKVIMDKGAIKTVDEAEILRNAQRASVEIWESFSTKYRQFPEVTKRFRYFRK